MPSMLNPGMIGQLGAMPTGGAGSITIGNSVFTPPPGIAPGTPEYEAWRTRYTTGGGAAAAATSGGGVPHGDLAAATNAFMTGQAQAPFLANLPNYASNIAARGQNTSDQLAGRFTQGQMDNFHRAAAERGIATGSPGSPNSEAWDLANILNQTNALQQQGSQNLSQSIADTPVPQLFNPASLFVPEMLARLEHNAAQTGFTGSLSSGPTRTTWNSGGGTPSSSISLPGGRLGQGVTNPASGTVGAGAPSGPILGTTQTGMSQQIASIASGDAYNNWWNQYGVPQTGGQGQVPQGFNSWDEANQFTDELFADDEAAYGGSNLDYYLDY